MNLDRLRAERLRSHRLSAPAGSAVAAAEHMLAVQAQEFWGGRWALAVRARGAPALSQVDDAFDGGRLVRSWTMRGTIHIVPSSDLGWLLAATGERQLRAAAGRHRALGLDADVLRRAERAVRGALAGGGRMTRAELFDLLHGIGVDPREQRGVHVIFALAVRGVIVQGPVVRRAEGAAREQFLVLSEEWLSGSAAPADPLAELFVRYVDGHGPAGVADFAWWSGLPLGVARRAVEAAEGRVVETEEGLFLSAARPRRSGATPAVIALPPFEEYYISYADRTPVCAPEHLAAVGPGRNGMVRPVLLARGEVVGVWTHSRAVGRDAEDAVPELWVPDAATDAEVAAALDRYKAFVTA